MENSAYQQKHWVREYFNLTSIPTWVVHTAALLGVYHLGFSWTGLSLAVGLYFFRMFFVTGAYHRYFSHKTYKTSRWFQFVLAFIGGMSVQKGALWWAAHHRLHHRHSDTPLDVHSPARQGIAWAHLGWILSRRYRGTETRQIPDLMKFPELVWLNEHYLVPVVVYVGTLYTVGELVAPGGGLFAVVWGFCVSTVALWHGTFTINSFTHILGRRRFETGEGSRNSWFLAIITMGEGWHNNHHYYQNSANQGFYWWEYDFSYYILRVLSLCGLIWDVRKPPRRVLEQGRRGRSEQTDEAGVSVGTLVSGSEDV